MPKTRKGSPIELYESHFAVTLRSLMDERKATQKQLAEYVGIRPQTISLYCTGETQPTIDNLCKIAEFFNVTTDFLITGKILEDIPISKALGFSESTVECLKLVNSGYFEDSPYMLPVLNALLGEKDFYTALDRAAKFSEQAKDARAEQEEFFEWKASKALEDFFLDFFKRDLKGMYDSLKGV